MTDFYTLDRDGQQAAMTSLARQALAHFGLADAPLKLLNYTNNAVFHVAGAAGAAYALRVHRPGNKRPAWIRSELAWLTALRRETELLVPEPAAPIYAGALPGIAEPVACVLFHWIEGTLLTVNPPTIDQAHAIGAFAGKLHQHSRDFTPPPDFARPRMDFEGLFGQDSPYNPGADGEALITPPQREVIDAATAQVRTVMDALGEGAESFGLIHADLIRKNMLLTDSGQLAVLDFDDCAYGYYLYELAPLLLFMRDEPHYADLRNALWRGYTSRLPLPEAYQAHLDTLVAARHIASIRWVAGNRHNPSIRGRVPEIIAQRVAELDTFLNTGSLKTATVNPG